MRTITTAMRWKALGSQCTTALHPFIPRRALSTEGRSAVASASASTSAPAPASKDTQQATTANGSHSSPKDHSPRTTSTSQKQRLKRLGNYTDVLSVRVQGGNGGSGCVHFAREPFRAVAPPDGGDGGRGGNVWLEVVEGGRDLGHLTRRYLAEHGGTGAAQRGRGKTGEDVVVPIPKGSIVHEFVPAVLPQEWRQRLADERTRTLQASSVVGAGVALKADDGDTRVDVDDGDDDADADLKALDDSTSHRAPANFQLPHTPLLLDTSHPWMPVGTRFLISTGGTGGQGNSHFATPTNRSPTTFTDGHPGQIRYLRIELKTIADIGLVGMPNAGKSSFLAGVTRCRTAVGHWAFTTLNPHLGTVHFPPEVVERMEDGSMRPVVQGGSSDAGHVANRVRAQLKEMQNSDDNGNDSDIHGRGNIISVNTTLDGTSHRQTLPPFSMNIADIPGIIAGAAQHNRGLGHTFLRHIEKARLLVYIVDLSRSEPWLDLEMLVRELEFHQKGMAEGKPSLVVANKADLVAGDGEGEGAGEDAGDGEHGVPPVDVRANYERLCTYVRDNLGQPTWEVIPISAKHQRNVTKVLWKMRGIVERSRELQEQAMREEVREAEELEMRGGASSGGNDDAWKTSSWNHDEFVRGVHQIMLPDMRRR